MRAVLVKSTPEDPTLGNLHEPAAPFQRGQPLTILARAPGASSAMISSVGLRYRHVNQGETWQMIEMERTGDNYRAIIAADYTDSPFPLQYHFRIRSDAGDTRLYPGLEHRWHGQPYYFLRQAI